MSAYKDTNGKWRAVFRYTDREGNTKSTQKRGFNTKKEALQYESDYKSKMLTDINMLFSSLVDIYFDSLVSRLRENTLKSKRAVVYKFIDPYFDNKKVSDIKSVDVMKWQNTILEQDLSDSYKRYIHVQLSSILNFAVKYYDLKCNPCTKAGSIGSTKTKEIKFFTLDEFKEVFNEISDKYRFPIKILYWTGMRIGELMALTANDFDFEHCIIKITKSYQRIMKKDIITDPKTPGSIRKITVPINLMNEIKEYTDRMYDKDDRLFSFNKQCLNRQLNCACDKLGIEKRTVHDLRHSHVSLLIELGYSPMLIAERLGHDKIETTLNIYGHLYPNKHNEVAKKLNTLI